MGHGRAPPNVSRAPCERAEGARLVGCHLIELGYRHVGKPPVVGVGNPNA